MLCQGASVRQSLTATRATRPIRLDGLLDEADWTRSTAASDFTQRYPNPGTSATLRTEVRVLYDDAAIYVGARMFDPRPDSIAAPLARKDPGFVSSDWFDVIFDSYHDGRTAFRFGVNPAGTKLDVYHFNDDDDDESWDALWDVSTRIDSLGWTAEYRIPLSQLRFRGQPGEQVWGLQFYRAVARRDEWSHWVPFLPTTPGFVSTFGELRGLVGLQPPSPLELSPYVSGGAATTTESVLSPFRRRVRTSAIGGVDFRLGLGSGLSVTGSINPDFGQVEVDPAVINLTAIETFLPEKRPFFVEGAGIFGFGAPPVSAGYGFSRFVHWRRIGRAPQLFPSAQWLDAPEQTTILGAAKLSGQLGDGWSVGVVEAATQEEDAPTIDATGARENAVVEPFTNYFVGRLKRDLQRGRSTIGLLSTSVNRRLNAETAGALRETAYLLGIDGSHATANRRLTASGHVVGSRVSGSTTAIAATQRSSARYFQRPDATYLELDPMRHALDGHDASATLAYRGTPWFGTAQVRDVSPGFEANDLGYLSRADLRSFTAAVGATRTNGTALLRDARAQLYTQHAWNYGANAIYKRYGFTLSSQLPSSWFASVNGAVKPSAFDDRTTRGGPLILKPFAYEAGAGLATDSRRRVVASASVSAEQNGARGTAGELTSSVVVRASAALQLSVRPTLALLRDEAQYVRSVADTFAVSTYARRYVFATLRQRTFSVDVRADWTLTPALSLQLFSQPFASAARFSDYKELRAPSTFAFDAYGRQRGTLVDRGQGQLEIDPDGPGASTSFVVGGNSNEASFLSQALRVNAVMRWEYRSGSFLYVVWQQTRDREELDSDPSALRLVRVMQVPAANVLRVKASYRFGS